MVHPSEDSRISTIPAGPHPEMKERRHLQAAPAGEGSGVGFLIFAHIIIPEFGECKNFSLDFYYPALE
jgi:hypothetical protein